MRCGKVKNPCKICFQSVSNKNGIQCKGACKKWAHFKCLNYTPGKISDIKAGLIKITCPCPDCTTSEPKELLTKPPFTCTNEGCPATKPPVCEVPDCPNKHKPIPPFPPPILTPPKVGSPGQLPPELIPHIPGAPKCPTPPRKSSCPSSPRNASPHRKASPVRKSSCPSSPRNASPHRIPSPARKPPCPSSRNASPRRIASPARKSSCPPSPKKASPRVTAKRPGSPPLEITATRPTCPSCPKHCPKSSRGKSSPDKLLSPQLSQSCQSFASGTSMQSGKSRFGIPRSCSSDSALLNVHDQKVLYSAIEQMCDTVGYLSSQLKDLMCKMMNVFQKNKQNSN